MIRDLIHKRYRLVLLCAVLLTVAGCAAVPKTTVGASRDLELDKISYLPKEVAFATLQEIEKFNANRRSVCTFSGKGIYARKYSSGLLDICGDSTTWPFLSARGSDRI